MKENGWLQLSPPFGSPPESDACFVRLARDFTRIEKSDAASVPALVDAKLRAYLEDEVSWPVRDRQMLKAGGLVLADLVTQGWSVRVIRGKVFVRTPDEILRDPAAEKLRVKRQELHKRDAQLGEPAVTAFIRSMERRRLFQGRFVSVFSLMRDGREFAEALRGARGQDPSTLERVIDPYLQFVTAGERCPWTGFELLEIWRYFRHTWTNQYVSVPGRTMLFVVRDRSAEFHPIVGIGALSSPIVQIRERDTWIGWDPSTFLQHMREHPTAALARWLGRIVDDALSEIYVDDFLATKVVSTRTLKTPTEAALETLTKIGSEARDRHRLLARKPRERDLADPQYFTNRARDDLFVSKRAFALVELLTARRILNRAFRGKPTAAALRTLIASDEGERILRRLIRKAKGDRVGIAMVDISVCGAVAPYNPVLGGKLVSMLAASPEVVAAYHSRYASAESEIASSMAGRPIVRPPHLVYLGTTSLYGVGSSQYNRLSIPCELLGGAVGTSIRFEEIGHSQKFGTSHYSEETLDALVQLVHQKRTGNRVNSIFGEGVSPKLRKVREGLGVLKFPAHELLQHGRRRIVYAVNLIENLRDFLLGIDATPKYFVPPSSGPTSTRQIADWWKRRWLANRINSDDVLDQVARQTLIHPIRHGARVVLPRDENEPQLPFSIEY